MFRTRLQALHKRGGFVVPYHRKRLSYQEGRFSSVISTDGTLRNR